MRYVLPVAMGLALAGCGGQTPEAEVIQDTEQATTVDSFELMAKPMELAGSSKDVLEEIQQQPVSKPHPQVKATTTANREKNKPETLYVETEGAQGRVWGHVTMRGDRGTGTIHDWDENTLTVSVTRHGNELFAVDQNSRQYVFKLKQNKTQE